MNAAPDTAPPENTAGLDHAQTANARTIITVAARLRLPHRAAVIAIATALQESDLQNLPGGDRDSIGLFQQRPSQGWGKPAQLRDPTHAATAFYRHLTAVPDWQKLPLTQAAQAVQRSATPGAYTAHAAHAQKIVTALSHATCQGPSAAGRGRTAVRWALSQRGKPYVWGADGPAAYDCSGLTLRAWQHAGASIPRLTYDQYTTGHRIPRARLQPGDLVFFHPGSRGPEHVGLYLGHGKMIHAPHTGDVVRISPINRMDYLGARRPD